MPKRKPSAWKPVSIAAVLLALSATAVVPTLVSVASASGRAPVVHVAMSTLQWPEIA